LEEIQKMTQSQSVAKVVELPEVLDVIYAAPLAESLLALRGSNVSVDAARVQRVGAQCVQVIMSALATWKADEVAFSVVEPSIEFREALCLLGIGLGEISAEEVAT
jgi:chemotaxis protein CheX